MLQRMFSRSVQVDDQGFLCLTDLWNASNKMPNSSPKRYLCYPTNKHFVELVKQKVGSYVVYERKDGSVWADPMVTLSYTSYLDPGFELFAFDVFDRVATDQPVPPLNDFLSLMVEYEKTDSEYDLPFRRSKIMTMHN